MSALGTGPRRHCMLDVDTNARGEYTIGKAPGHSGLIVSGRKCDLTWQ